MSGNVVSIGSESLVDFIAREGVTNTGNVAGRFGWDMAEARRRLHELERQGIVTKPALVEHPGTQGGAVLEWRLTPAALAPKEE